MSSLLHRNRYLLARRVSQLGLLGLFLAGPLGLTLGGGLWLVKGTLASSLTLGVLPLTDPLILLQTLLAGHWPELTALTGAAIVVGFYLLVGGRAYCSWVCPINMVTDGAGWLHRRLGWKTRMTLPRHTRFWVLGAVLALSVLTGTAAWEAVNPITMLHRGLVFGTLLTGGLALSLCAAVFLLDLALGARSWCGHICPVGAFYSLIGKVSLIKVKAGNRQACDNCLDCYRVCPEPHVISPALRGAARGLGPVVASPDCTNCGRCIDVCSKDVFQFATRFNSSTTPEKGESAL